MQVFVFQALEKLKQDYQKGLTNETKITLPSVKFFTGGAASQAGNESGFNPKISGEKKNAKSLSSILDFLNKAQEADSCSKVNTAEIWNWNKYGFQMVKKGWVANGPDFEWDLKSGSSTLVVDTLILGLLFIYIYNWNRIG